MKIYVQSCGIAQKHGYCWLGEDSQKRVDEPEQVKKIQHLIDSEAHSLILARGDSDELLLLVTGFTASERKDFMGRTILTSVAWVGKKDDEGKLRAIAVRALQSFRGEDSLNDIRGEDSLNDIRGEDSLNDIISKAVQPDTTEGVSDAVQPDTTEGFKVKFESLAAEKLAKTVEVKNKEPNLTMKIGIADNRAGELKEDLKEYKLPGKKGPLVVYTGSKNQSALEEAKVWRGLSSLVQNENWDEKKMSGETVKGASHADKRLKFIIILIVSISLSVLIFLLIISQLGKKPSQVTPTPSASPTPQS